MKLHLVPRFRAAPAWLIFCLFWLATFALYVQDIKAGWVIDAAGWLWHVRHDAFWDYLNRKGSQINSLYQFTQLITWVFYKIWGANNWAWGLLYITMHSINALLLFLIFSKLFTDSGITFSQSRIITFTAILLWTVCPHNSEVLIWKACYHYLQGFMMILLCLFWMQQFQYVQKPVYAVAVALLFLCSVFSLEVFYLTPVCTLGISIYYRIVLKVKKSIFRKSVLWFLLPQLMIIVYYGFVFRCMYPGGKPHVYNLLSQSPNEYLSKIPANMFHLVFLGRYFPWDMRKPLYELFHQTFFLTTFYAVFVLLIATVCIVAIRSKKREFVIAELLLGLLLAALALLIPLPFPVNSLYVFYDRYLYVAGSFFFLLLSFLIWNVRPRIVSIGLLITYGICNLYCTLMVNHLWKDAAYVDNRLIQEFPAKPGKTILLLNVPENMMGAAMIGANPDGAFKSLRELMVDSIVKNPVYDVLSFVCNTRHDGVHCIIKNDSVMQVVFSQCCNWWIYDGRGAVNYENSEYSVRLQDNSYILTLKHPAQTYQLLYVNDGMWYEQKWERRNPDLSQYH